MSGFRTEGCKSGQVPEAVQDSNFIRTTQPRELFQEAVSHLSSTGDLSRLSRTSRSLKEAVQPRLDSEKLVQDAHLIKDPAGIEKRLSEIGNIPQASLRARPLWALTHRLNALEEHQFVDTSQKVKYSIQNLPAAAITAQLETCIELIENANQYDNKTYAFNYNCASTGPAVDEVLFGGNVADIADKHDIRPCGGEGGLTHLEYVALKQGPQGQSIVDQIRSGKDSDQAIAEGKRNFSIKSLSHSGVSDCIHRRMNKSNAHQSDS